MIYYKVPKDGQVYNTKTCKCTSIVENELLTAKECERIGLNYKKLLPVEVSQKKLTFSSAPDLSAIINIYLSTY